MFIEGTNIDLDLWPIIVIKQADAGDDEMNQRNLVALDELYTTRKEPYVTVMDARGGKRPNAGQRYLQTEFRRKHQDHVKTYCRGFAIVTTSEAIKGVTSAMFMIKEPDTVTELFTDMDSAVAWARERLGT